MDTSDDNIPDVVFTSLALYKIVLSYRIEEYDLAIDLLEELIGFGRRSHLQIPEGVELLQALKLKYVLKKIKCNDPCTFNEIEKYFQGSQGQDMDMYRQFLMMLYSTKHVKDEFFNGDYKKEFGSEFRKMLANKIEKFLWRIVPFPKIFQKISTATYYEKLRLDLLMDRMKTIGSKSLHFIDINFMMSLFRNYKKKESKKELQKECSNVSPKYDSATHEVLKHSNQPSTSGMSKSDDIRYSDVCPVPIDCCTRKSNKYLKDLEDNDFEKERGLPDIDIESEIDTKNGNAFDENNNVIVHRNAKSRSKPNKVKVRVKPVKGEVRMDLQSSLAMLVDEFDSQYEKPLLNNEGEDDSDSSLSLLKEKKICKQVNESYEEAGKYMDSSKSLLQRVHTKGHALDGEYEDKSREQPKGHVDIVEELPDTDKIEVGRSYSRRANQRKCKKQNITLLKLLDNKQNGYVSKEIEYTTKSGQTKPKAKRQKAQKKEQPCAIETVVFYTSVKNKDVNAKQERIDMNLMGSSSQRIKRQKIVKTQQDSVGDERDKLSIILKNERNRRKYRKEFQKQKETKATSLATSDNRKTKEKIHLVDEKEDSFIEKGHSDPEKRHSTFLKDCIKPTKKSPYRKYENGEKSKPVVTDDRELGGDCFNVFQGISKDTGEEISEASDSNSAYQGTLGDTMATSELLESLTTSKLDRKSTCFDEPLQLDQMSMTDDTKPKYFLLKNALQCDLSMTYSYNDEGKLLEETMDYKELTENESVVPPSVEASPTSLELDMFEDTVNFLDNEVKHLPDLSRFLLDVDGTRNLMK